jgi:DNA mismatch repair protein MutS2
MTFPADFEQRLGFDQIRDRMLSYCLGQLGRDKISAIRFLTSPDLIKTMMTLNHEAKCLNEKGDDFPIQPYDDPTPWLEIAAVPGSYLEIENLSAIASALLMIRTANARLVHEPVEFPALAKLAIPSSSGKRVIDNIRSCIDESARMKDSASPGLNRIRKRLRDEELKARKVADQIMRQALEKGWCPEGANPTIRDGRLVIPLLAEHKRKIKGYLVDQSATGQTVFLEPADVMEANNDLRDLVLDERKEIVRILLELTGFIYQQLDEIRLAYDLLGTLDFHRSKARLSLDLKAELPVLVSGPALHWTHARHPLLFLALRSKRPLVPLTISLTVDDRFLLVSGPNAGGKSVCLKTVGLIQYMAQCGMLVPMQPDSKVGIFQSIFLDIGDQQSIESDLSTYSSHLKNMAHFINHGNAESLILMDELGSGTDPNFGGGIAQAILEQLLKKKTWGLATTHFYNLKVFASHFPGIRNASMQFDTEKLVPLFQLEIGQPGSSFALEIAKNIGMPDSTLKEAVRIIGSELIGLETLMKQVAEEKLRIEEREKSVTSREVAVLKAQQSYEALQGKLESQKKDILNSAKTEASILLRETNREIEKTIRHIRENKAEKQETRKVRQGLRDMEKKVKPQDAKQAVISGPLKEGDKVRIIGGEVTGTVISVKKSGVTVEFGSLRSTVKPDRLTRSDQADFRRVEPTVKHVAYSGRQMAFSSMLDVRGMRVEEVLPLLTRFIDDAIQFGVHEVSILHGKGEGVLRKVVREYLKGLNQGILFRDEHADRGGDGITLVDLK